MVSIILQPNLLILTFVKIPTKMIDPDKMEIITDQVKAYISTNIELLKLEAADRISDLISGLISNLLIASIGFLCLFFISLWAGFYISSLASDTYTGFAVVAGVYLIPGLILYVGRKRLLKEAIRNNIISNIFKDKQSQ